MDSHRGRAAAAATALVTDLDNTLYDWATSFAASFQAMLDELVALVGVDEATLRGEFRAVHRELGSTERSFAALDLPSVRQRFPGAARRELASRLRPAFAAFDRARHAALRLYPDVAETLEELRRRGTRVIAHTEAPFPNAAHRLRVLGIDHHFDRVYAGACDPEPLVDARSTALIVSDRLRRLARGESKPDPRVLADICAAEGMPLDATVFVGDSLSRDVAMANGAGITSVWARYGTRYDPALRPLLESITHWTDGDLAADARVRTEGDLTPHFVIDSFADILPIVAGDRPVSAARPR